MQLPDHGGADCVVDWLVMSKLFERFRCRSEPYTCTLVRMHTFIVEQYFIHSFNLSYVHSCLYEKTRLDFLDPGFVEWLGGLVVSRSAEHRLIST